MSKPDIPRNYKRKRNRQRWSADCMMRALQEVLKGRIGYKKAAQTFSTSQSTLKDTVKKVCQRGLSPASERQEKKAPKRRLFSPTQDKKGSKAKKEKKKEKTANETITNKEEKKVVQESSLDVEDHEACMFCKELYSQSRAKEGWIQCSIDLSVRARVFSYTHFRNSLADVKIYGSILTSAKPNITASIPHYWNKLPP
ncbi:hypothetical protein ILUMI_26028 [Ignelater luminosus]|uniref:HTH psq-type domain-containing protein n=1 Tax=Ignelater luminosus TaxID=2038154 RepID=A0A8K0C460_IGNLU|nr:hypothetical protein ILUMI_26028 [Ignelater luminosus]